jgi:MscS family membrane protein
MENLKQMITSIDLNNLLKLFDLQIAIAVFIFFFIFRTVFSKILIKIYYWFIKCKKSPKESSMYKPLKVFFILLGVYIMIKILPVTKQQLEYINEAFKIIIIYYITKAITTLIDENSFIMKKIFKEPGDKTVNRFLCKVIRTIVWVAFGFIVLKEIGYDLTTFVAALGIGSAAIALAAQDLVKSLISGVSILTDKPFVIGDWIEVGDYAGTVVDITFRSIRIKSASNAVITIPNSTITSEYVVNWNRLNSRRFECTLNLSLETPTEKIRKIIKEIKLVLENNPQVIKGTTQVSLNAISACSSDIQIFLYVNEANYIKFLKIKEDILCSLLFVCEKENVDLAYPTQTLYVKRKEEVGE